MRPDRENSTRTKARKRALDILYESELRERDAAETLTERLALAEPPVRPFTVELVQGWLAHRDAVDAQVSACLTGAWTLQRMACVDRNLARLAVYEMGWTDTPPQVVIDEAVGLAAELSTPESPAFLNAVLAAASASGPVAAHQGAEDDATGGDPEHP